MITIKNTQRKIPVNKSKLGKQIAAMLKSVGYKDFDIGVWLTTNKTIQRYNKKFRTKDKPTDILSFPFHPNLKPKKYIVICEQEEKNLGDLIISLEFAKKGATAWNRSFAQHLTALIAHGIAHLLGYTHDTSKDTLDMQKIEKKLVHATKQN